MKENPLFANTCGKIYDEVATFAFEHKEKTIRLNEIEKVRTEVGITLKSFFVTLMPLSLLSFVYLIKDIDIVLKTILIALTVLFSAISLFNAERTFHLVLTLKDGAKLKIRVSENNRKDAEKFAVSLTKRIQQK